MKRLRILAAAVLLATAALSLCASIKALPGGDRSVWVTGPAVWPDPRPVALNCPFLIDLRWSPPPTRTCSDTSGACTLTLWYWERGHPGDDMHDIDNPPFSERNDFLRDEYVAPGQQWNYRGNYYYECSDSEDNCLLVYSMSEPVTVAEACRGLLYEDLDFPGGTHYLDWIRVEEDAVLTIGGPRFLPYEDDTAGLSCCHSGSTDSDCSKEEAQIRIDGGEFISVNVSLTGGWVNNAIFQGGGNISVGRDEPSAEKVTVRGNTLDGGEIYIVGTSALVENNKGAFDVQLGSSNTEVTFQKNVLTGTVDLVGGKLLLRDNTVTGRIAVRYGPTVILTGNSIHRVDPSQPGIELRSRSGDGKVLAYGRNHFIDHVSSLSRPWNPLLKLHWGGEVSIWNSWITGNLVAEDDVSLNLYGNKEVRGRISIGSGATSEIVANRLVLSGTLGNGGHLTLTDNVITGDGVRPASQGPDRWADAQGNTFRDLDSHWAFDIYHVDSPVRIKNNCIESDLGVIVRGPRDVTRTLDARHNWWGDPTGPHHSERNPESRGANISGPVDFDPPLPGPSPCRDAPPQSHVSISTVIGPGGGSLLTPDGAAALDFPPGAVDEPTRVTYDSDGSTLQAGAAAALAPADDRVVIRAFDLSAVISGTTTPVRSFSEPYTVTLYYTDEDRGSAIESTLDLYWWDGSAWLPEPSCQLYQDEDRLMANLDHMTLFAVMGQTHPCYLPLVVRGS